MARLFWIATGSAVTVAVIVKGRQVVRRYTPAAVAERATATVEATTANLSDVARHFASDFRAARDERATALADALLARTQGTVEDLRARRDARSGARDEHATRAAFAPERDDDEDDLGYSF